MLRYYRRSLALFLVLAFLAVQAGLDVHVAKYGNGKHQHNGTTCSLYLFTDHNHFAETFAPPAVIAPLFTAIAVILFLAFTYKPATCIHSHARAPPFSLQF